MSDSESAPRRGRLPPLGSPNSETTSVDRTPRKKKPKPRPGDSTDRETPRRMPPRPQNSARSRADSEAETERGSSAREIPPRPRPKKQKIPSLTVEALEDIEGEEETPRPRKKKTKPKVTESQEELVEIGQTVNGDLATDRSGADKPKKKKKKKVGIAGPTGVGLEAELYELEDDIITEANDSFEENRYGHPAVMRSEPINKIFIEQKSGFKTANKDKIARKRANQLRQAEATTDTQTTKSTIQFAISSHRVFKTIVLFLQGLLGGICLWQIVSVYMLKKQGYDVLLQQYKPLAMPVQCVFYFLLALSSVAVFDKNDIARPNKKFIIQSATMQTTAIACFFYLAALVFNLAIADIDDKINLYDPENTDQTFWEEQEERDNDLKKWVILNLVRGLMAILGWLVISISPKSDRLIQNLEKADENIIEGVEGDTEAVLRAAGV